jgi:hypothetical protein
MLLRRVIEHVKTQNWTAVGLDFVIVVVGVFIGIQFSNWNDTRQEVALEQRYIERLADDLEEDISNFRQLETIFQTKIDFISSLMDGDVEQLIELPAETLLRDLNYSTFKSFPPTISATFDELQSSGRLTLLRDVELRDALSSYYIWFKHLAHIHEEPIGSYTQLVAEIIPGQSYYEWQVHDQAKTSANLDAALRALSTDDQLVEAGNAELFYASKLIFHVRESRSDAEKLLATLREYSSSS